MSSIAFLLLTVILNQLFRFFTEVSELCFIQFH